MRLNRALVMMGLVLAMTGMAGAITFNQAYSGPLKFKFSNYDSTRVYIGPDGTYTADSGPCGLTLTDLNNTAYTSGASYGSIAPAGGASGEDAWGLFELTTILGQDPTTGQYNVVLWEKGGASDTNPDIVGMFYGITYSQVTLTTRSDGTVQEEVWGTGGHVDLYEVPNGSAILSDPNARTSINSYPLWTVGTAVLSGDGLTGQFVTPPAASSDATYWSTIIFDPTNGTIVGRESAVGSAKLFVEWYGGSSYDQFHIPGVDMVFNTDTYGNETTYDWTTNSDDPAFGGTPGAVPEPVTMLGMFLAMGTAGHYVRRRLAK